MASKIVATNSLQSLFSISPTLSSCPSEETASRGSWPAPIFPLFSCVFVCIFLFLSGPAQRLSFVVLSFVLFLLSFFAFSCQFFSLVSCCLSSAWHSFRFIVSPLVYSFSFSFSFSLNPLSLVLATIPPEPHGKSLEQSAYWVCGGRRTLSQPLHTTTVDTVRPPLPAHSTDGPSFFSSSLCRSAKQLILAGLGLQLQR